MGAGQLWVLGFAVTWLIAVLFASRGLISPKESSRKVDESKPFVFSVGGVFYGSMLLSLLGVAGTILTQRPQFLWLSALGLLTVILIGAYLDVTYSKDISRNEVIFESQSTWYYDHFGTLVLGIMLCLGGGTSALWLSNGLLVLLSGLGGLLVFFLWAYATLANSVTITEKKIVVKRLFPREDSITLSRADTFKTEVGQNLLHRMFRLYYIRILSSELSLILTTPDPQKLREYFQGNVD